METLAKNADAVNSVIERAAQLTAAEAEMLSAAWDAAWEVEGGSEEDSAIALAGQSALAVAWADAERGASWIAAGFAVLDATEGIALSAAARGAAQTAAQAAVVRGLISDEDYEVLAGPWESVMGPVFPEDTDTSTQH